MKHDVLSAVDDAFSRLSTAAAADQARSEARAIDKRFCAGSTALSQKHAASLIQDATLLTDAAFLHFLPELARAAVLGEGDGFLLARRAQTVSRSGLSPLQVEALEQLSAVLMRLEDELDKAEREAVERANTEWRDELRRRPSPNNNLLLAAEEGDKAGVERAIREGADINYADQYGNTAANLARANHHVSILGFLEKYSTGRTDSGQS